VAIIVVSTLFTKRQFETDWRIRAAVKSTRPVTKLTSLVSSRSVHCRHVNKLERQYKLALKELRRIDREIYSTRSDYSSRHETEEEEQWRLLNLRPAEEAAPEEEDEAPEEAPVEETVKKTNS
jgi:hypothetical protein